MLQKIFKHIFKSNDKYEEYEENNKKIFNVLKNRANITSPSQKEILSSMDKVLESKLLIKDQQRLIEKLLIKIKAMKYKSDFNIFMWKQENKVRFEIYDKDFINEFKEESGKKTLTIEDKKVLFRERYKDKYEEFNQKEATFNSYIEELENERIDLIDTKKLLTEYLEVLKRVLP